MSTLIGSRVEMVEAESSFTGRVIQENASLGKLVVLLESGELQNFFRRDLTSITVLKESREVKISDCFEQSSQVDKKMQDSWPRTKVEEVRSVDVSNQMQSVPSPRVSFADKQCVRSEEEMKEIFASVRPELPVLPSRIERPETLGKVLLLPSFKCAATFSSCTYIPRLEVATAIS